MKYSEKYTITSFDVDINNNMRPTSLINYLQETANHQMRDRKPSYYDFFREGKSFVVTRMSIEVLEQIGQYEEVEVRTHLPQGRHHRPAPVVPRARPRARRGAGPPGPAAADRRPRRGALGPVPRPDPAPRPGHRVRGAHRPGDPARPPGGDPRRRRRRLTRSEERRVGKECRSRWSPYH